MPDKYQNKYRIPSARLPGWDYGWEGSYFVTICTKNREMFFGNISGGQMHLFETGIIAEQCWLDIPIHFPYVRLGRHVVMPNHVHGIITIENNGGLMPGNDVLPVETLQCNVSTQPPQPRQPPQPPPITTIIDETPPPPNEIPNEKNEFMASISPKRGSLSTIIRSYKSAVSKQAHVVCPEFNWQERFHDHIIRDEGSFGRIEYYIVNNIAKWEADKFFTR